MTGVPASAAAPRAVPPLRRVAREIPLAVLALLLLGTASGILPPGAIVAAGPVELTLARLLIIAALVSLVAVERPRRALFGTGLAIPLGLLLAVALLSTLQWEGTEARFRFLVEGVAVFYLTFAVIRSRPEARLALLGVALVALAIAALAGVAQVAQGEPTGFYRQGCVPVTEAPPTVPRDSLTRAIGTFENPNVLGGYLLLLAPLGGLAAALLSPRRELRVALGLVVVLGYLAVGLTFSRAGVLMGLLALGAGLAVSGRRAARYLAPVAVAVAIGASFLLAGCGSEAGAGFGRQQEWRETIAVARANPVYGIGLGRLGDVLRARDERSTARHAHNLWLTWWGEAGTGALIAWVWIFVVLLWRLVRAARHDALAAGVLVALGGFAGASLLDHPANVDRVALALWIVAGLAAAVAATARDARRAEP